MAARKSGIADYCGLSRILSVETRYIFLDGNLIGEIIYDKEDTRYYSIWIQVDEKRFYEFDLKRKMRSVGLWRRRGYKQTYTLQMHHIVIINL